MMYGLGLVPEPCADELRQRNSIAHAVGATLEPWGISFSDIDRELAKKFADPVVLKGFGRNLGSRHLNVAGHKAYAEILARAISGFDELR